MLRKILAATIFMAVIVIAPAHLLMTHETRKGIANDSPKEEANKPHRWVQAIAAGRGQWPEAAKEGQWPLSVIPIVAFGDKLWMVGHGKAGNYVWYSSDGINWQKAQTNAGWGERYGMTRVFFDNKIWAMGGSTDDWEYKNDVWYTSDGLNWQLATERAGWSPRRGHATVVFEGKMWVIGGAANVGPKGTGEGPRRDVWSSADGVTWTQVTDSAPWSARGDHLCLALKDKLWLIGGRSDQETLFDESWYTSDGKNWTRAASDSGWMGRFCAGAQVFEGEMWIFGGSRKRDIWRSGDGINWTRVTADAPWALNCAECGRCGNCSVVFKNKIWIFGGKNEQNGFAQDVWYMASSAR